MEGVRKRLESTGTPFARLDMATFIPGHAPPYLPYSHRLLERFGHVGHILNHVSARCRERALGVARAVEAERARAAIEQEGRTNQDVTIKAGIRERRPEKAGWPAKTVDARSRPLVLAACPEVEIFNAGTEGPK
jgi:hypothetical protein